MRETSGFRFAERAQSPYQRLQDVMLVRAVLSLAAFIGVAAAALDRRTPLSWWLLGVMVLMVLSNAPLRRLAKGGRLTPAVWLMILADIAFLAFCTHLLGGAGRVTTLLLVWPILIAGLLLGPRAGGATALLASAACVGLTWAEGTMWKPLDLLEPLGLSLRGSWPAAAAAALTFSSLALLVALLTDHRRLGSHGHSRSRLTRQGLVATEQGAEPLVETLAEFGRLFRDTEDVDALLPHALEFLTRRSGADAGFVALDRPDQTQSTVAARQGISEKECGALLAGALPAVVERGAGIAGLIERPETDLKAFRAVPLRLAGTYLGTLYLLGRSALPPPVDGWDLAESVAGQLAVALRNTQFNNELRTAHEDLLRMDQLKSDFLATMSHELRTPLTSVVGYADMLLSGLAGDVSEPQKTFLRGILSSSETLLNLINDLLDLTKIQAGRMDLRLAPVQLSDALAGSVALVQPQARQKRINLSMTIPPVLPPLLADPSRLEQVLTNLLSNAIKFSPDGSEVSIMSRALPTGQAEVSVTDNGVGIAEEDLGRIFERFSQVDGTSTRRQNGTGLGLAITRDIVELHGGHVAVRSQPGQGSTFVFTIPLALGS